MTTQITEEEKQERMARLRVMECASRIHQGYPGDMVKDGPFWDTVEHLASFVRKGKKP